MNKNFFEKINKSGYHIFLFSCSAVFPLNFFFNHSWFVIVKDGNISRWEVRFETNDKNPITGKHLHFNTSKPFVGTSIAPYVYKHLLWKPSLLKYIDGREGSLAQKMYDFIENSDKKYKYKNNYFPTGPNCNTYIQWILNSFPEFDIKLSWRFIGKKYKNL